MLYFLDMYTSVYIICFAKETLENVQRKINQIYFWPAYATGGTSMRRRLHTSTKGARAFSTALAENSNNKKKSVTTRFESYTILD